MSSLVRINPHSTWQTLSRNVNLVRNATTATTTASKPTSGSPSPNILGASSYKFDNAQYGKDIAFIEGARTPFLMAGTDYDGLLTYELQRLAISALVKKVGLPMEKYDYAVCGSVIQEPKTQNVAREAILSAGLPNSIPANTVIQACVSANQAVTSAVGYLNSGTYNVIIAGGVDMTSDVPIRLSRKMRKLLLQLNKTKTTMDKLKLLSQIRLDYFIPELPAINEFFTEEVMGHASDRLAAAFKVSRREQDEFAYRSHSSADRAFKEGLLTDLTPVVLPNKGLVHKDNGVRVTSLEKMAKLKPAFIKPHGTVTAGNSSYLTDGATACLLTTKQKAQELGLKPKAYLRQHMYVSIDPYDQVLLGPAYVIARILDNVGLTIQDIDVWELHEAFAGQVLSNLRALDCDYFCKNHIGRPQGKLGAIDINKLNNWGGSLSIGHPFGATGVRLVTHACNRLIKENGRFAMVAACAGGAIGHGMLIERCP